MSRVPCLGIFHHKINISVMKVRIVCIRTIQAIGEDITLFPISMIETILFDFFLRRLR